MPVRAVEWKKPYTWGKWIEVDENKVINLRLRAENNLIIYDEWDNEIYVDLQLPDELRPTDAFPVWITTWRAIVDNGWDWQGTIVCFKTTSWDNIKLFYADDWKLYIDNGTGVFKQIYLKWDVDALIQALRDYIDAQLLLKQDKLIAGENIVIAADGKTISAMLPPLSRFLSIWDCETGLPDSFPTAALPFEYITWDHFIVWTVDTTNNPPVNYRPSGTEFTGAASQVLESADVQPWDVYIYDWNQWLLQVNHDKVVTFSQIAWQPSDNTNLATALNAKANTTDVLTKNNTTQYTPIADYNPATKKYIDDKVTSSSTAPSSPAEWMLWYDTVNDKLKTYNWSTWKDVDTPAPVTSVNSQTWIVELDADDISDSSTTNKFVTAAEKSTWNSKQGQLTAWPWISIWTVNDYSAMRWPCDSWFHIPSWDDLHDLIKIVTNEFGVSFDDWVCVVRFKMPGAGYRDYGDGTVQQSWRFWAYRTCSTYDEDRWISMFYTQGYIQPWANSFVSQWFSIRPFKDEPVAADSSRTTLVDWTTYWLPSWTWVFWSSSLWLISITSDWTNWMTIADKNLWATTAYSYWDTPSQAVCGNFYQWGNNYWFPWSWSISTDSNIVDITWYWPWNFYTNSTFVTEEVWYDDTNLDCMDLRWGVTWMVQINNVISNTAEWTVVSWTPGTTYTVQVSSSAPASWTPNTTITFVL